MALTLLEHLRALFGNIEDSSGTIEDEARRVFRRSKGYSKEAADAADATTTAATCFWVANSDCKVVAANFLPRGALAASGTTNYGTVQLLSGDGTATPAAVVGSCDSQTVAFADGVARALTLVAAQQSLSAGDTLAFAITKTGTGATIPAGEMIVELEEE
jgi:hypothetical protein